MILCANKCDLTGEARHVPFEHLATLASSLSSSSFFEVSSKTAENVDEAFIHLIEEILKPPEAKGKEKGNGKKEQDCLIS